MKRYTIIKDYDCTYWMLVGSNEVVMSIDNKTLSVYTLKGIKKDELLVVTDIFV